MEFMFKQGRFQPKAGLLIVMFKNICITDEKVFKIDI